MKILVCTTCGGELQGRTCENGHNAYPGRAVNLRWTYTIIHAPSHPGGYRPTPDTLEAARRFQKEYGGEIRRQLKSAWENVEDE